MEADIPKEIVTVLLCEEVLLETHSEVTELFTHQGERVSCRVFGDEVRESAVEHLEVGVVLLQQQVEDATVLLRELAVSKFGVRDRLPVLVASGLRLALTFAVQRFWVLNHHI